jgi:predicted nucleotidyltransferase
LKLRNIDTIKFGSHLYGTSTPASDLDYKSVFVPCARDIILQRVKATVSNERPKGMGEKNYAGEIDQESHSLQRFLDLVRPKRLGDVTSNCPGDPVAAMVDGQSYRARDTKPD